MIGATERPGAVGAAVMRNLIDGGFPGALLPLNLRRREVFGLPAHARVGDLALPPDLAVLCTPAATVPGLVRECGEAGVGGLLILSAGFRETGPRGAALERLLRAELDHFPQMRAVGPNCVGVIVPTRRLDASFAGCTANPGGIALLSQSGALCAAMLGWARDQGIGFSHFVSVGNMVDVDFGDLLDDAADRPETTAVVLYVEAITDAPRFLEAARRCTARKPVIAYKAGRHAAGARAAASHTGAMAGEDAVYQAAFDEVGIIRVDRLDDLLATAELLERGRRPRGAQLAIVTNAGGPGVIATDALMAGQGALANLSAPTRATLETLLPGGWSHANPVDVIGDAGPERLALALETVLGDDEVHAGLVILTPQAMIDVSAAARAVASVASGTDKPVLAAWMGGGIVREAVGILQAAGIPTYDTPDEAVGAFLHLAAHAEGQRSLANARDFLPRRSPIERRSAAACAAQLLSGRRGTLSEAQSKGLLARCGIPVAAAAMAATAERAVAAAREIGYPVVLKVHSAQITHKTDVGGVKTDLRCDQDVRAAFELIVESARRLRPDALVEGVTVQPMLDRALGVELIVGVRRDATFGPVVLVGAGGTMTEVLADRAIGLAPIAPGRAMRLARMLRIAPLLEGFRGRPPLRIEALADVMAKMSELIADCPEIREAEANPVLLTPAAATVLDARVVLEGQDA